MTENNERPAADDAEGVEATPANDADATARSSDATLPLTPPTSTASAHDTAYAHDAAATDGTAAAPPAAPAEKTSFWARTGVRIAAVGVAAVALLGLGAGAGWAAHNEARGAGEQAQPWGHDDEGEHGDESRMGPRGEGSLGPSAPGERSDRGPHGARDGDRDGDEPRGERDRDQDRERDRDRDRDRDQDTDSDGDSDSEQNPEPLSTPAS